MVVFINDLTGQLRPVYPDFSWVGREPDETVSMGTGTNCTHEGKQLLEKKYINI